MKMMKFKKSLVTETDGLMGPLARRDMIMMKTQEIPTVHVREVDKLGYLSTFFLMNKGGLGMRCELSF